MNTNFRIHLCVYLHKILMSIMYRAIERFARSTNVDYCQSCIWHCVRYCVTRGMDRLLITRDVMMLVVVNILCHDSQSHGWGDDVSLHFAWVVDDAKCMVTRVCVWVCVCLSVGPIANLKGLYFRPSLSVCLSVYLSVRVCLWPALLHFNVDRFWWNLVTRTLYCDLVWPRP